MSADQDLGGGAAPDAVVASGLRRAGAPDRSDVVVPLPLCEPVDAVRMPLDMSEFTERTMPLVTYRLDGFQQTEGRPATRHEIIAIAIESVLDQQALDRLMAALNEQEAMP